MKHPKNHPTILLEDKAADSLDRYEDDHGVINITSGYRSQAEQDYLNHRWAVGGTANRPPYLYQPAKKSRHTLGVALDTPDVARMRANAVEYGWRFLFPYDKVHMEYDVAYDKHARSVKHKRPVLKLGSRSQDVRDLQVILNKYHGAKLVPDGLFGSSTAKAVAKFQKKAKLKQDKIVGPDTWRKLGQ